MEQKIDNKQNLKDQMLNFYNLHKTKIFVFFVVLLIIISIIMFLKIKAEKDNNLIAQKYIQAGLSLSKEKNQSINSYEEIILSKNKFYAMLALNTLIEKNLVTDKEKILKYFNIVEKISKKKEKQDLLLFKKALYLISISRNEEAYLILNNLINDKSNLSNLAQEIVSK